MVKDIWVQPVLNGFVCQVGCQRVVFTSLQDMVEAIEQYYVNPERTEKDYIEGAINKTMYPMDMPQPIDPVRAQMPTGEANYPL